MRPIVLHGHYVILDPDGDIIGRTITDERMIAECVYLADQMPSSVQSHATEAGYKLIQCDIVFTNIKIIK